MNNIIMTENCHFVLKAPKLFVLLTIIVALNIFIDLLFK